MQQTQSVLPTVVRYTGAEVALHQFDDLPCDYVTTPQARLDLDHKQRSSLLPWRGQFSPELVALLIEQYSRPDSVLLDPFAGSGTTLFEAARKNLACYGVEINPAAVEMARTAHFVTVDKADRAAAIKRTERLIETHIQPAQPDLFSYQSAPASAAVSSTQAIDAQLEPLLAQAADPLVHNILANTIMRYLDSPTRNGDQFLRAFREHAGLITALPYSGQACTVFHNDARTIPLATGSVDLVITSPPYINVFNYHQNNRPAMERMGWDLLAIAKSEIGSNRKNRQNRFLTVVQYALDMTAALGEMRRLLRPTGRAIVVVGRESNVRGVPFRNGRLVAALAVAGAGFRLASRQERKFQNKFGSVIYEDILHLFPVAARCPNADAVACVVARAVLAEAAGQKDETVQHEIQDAWERAGSVPPSPLLSLPACAKQASAAP
ncbi:MAG: site-specific DNA-methyltransferase [Chloroflexota bacterium]|nr:site-specific DNA-methyltransferase [Chloroflexota bacterium]